MNALKKFYTPHEEDLISITKTWSTECPICGATTKWKLGGHGKNYHQICEVHGFVAIRRNPILDKNSAFEIWDVLFGRTAEINMLGQIILFPVLLPVAIFVTISMLIFAPNTSR